MYSSKIWFRFFVVLGSLVGRDSIPVSDSMEAVKDGDIMLGGLFPIHQCSVIVNTSSSPVQHVCEKFTLSRVIQVLKMIETVESINNSSMLNNLTIGYKILDTCSDATIALQHTSFFIDRRSGSRSSMFHAVIGEYHSEISMAVGRLLTIEYMPQISYGSTAGVLKDKNRFPTFRRTVPEDDHQAKAIAQILRYHNWTWFGIISTDGDYGRNSADLLEKYAKYQNIYVAYRTVLPDILNNKILESKLNESIQIIESTPKVQVIVSFAKPQHMSLLFEKLTPNASGRFWIAGDSWATSFEVLNNRTLKEVGAILGITFLSGNSSNFKSFLKNLDLNPASHPNNTILQHFLRQNINQSKSPEEIRETLLKSVCPHSMFSVGLAVQAVASAVKGICSNKTCLGGLNIQPSELDEALNKTMFTMDNETYRFGESGDMETGYDVILWEETNRNPKEFINNVTLKYVARYIIEKEDVTFLTQSYISQVDYITSHVTSRCSPSCLPGFKRVFFDGKPTCCFKCEQCPPNTFSNKTDADECEACSETHWSPLNATLCTLRKNVFLSWNDHYCITLLVFASLGLLLTLIVMLVFLVNWTTPVVVAAGGPISILILLSLLGTFTSSVLFGGRPTDIQCQTGQVLFGLSFTLCVSCILVKYFKILLAFKPNSAVKRVLKKMFLPYWIIGICVVFQGIICGLWLWKSPPLVFENGGTRSELLIQCAEGSFLFFGLMLSLIGLLALVCFGFAFLGRNLPECYNEEKCISFSMLIYIISWVVFGPIYMSSTASVIKYKPAVQMVVMLISAYGILFCHFMPKSYIILFKRKHNTKDAFNRGIREFTKRLFRRSFKVNQNMSGHESTDSSFTIDSGIENILNGTLANPFSTGTTSSFHLSVENLPQEVHVSADSVYGSSLTFDSSAKMNVENLKNYQTLSGSPKPITCIRNRPELKRTSSVP
ncbi:G-protein coupled receptor family C group 6 member A-like [Myxocyprinus asiaticus]|uniref:G-protein coupled receptor family C group 6 member A-like n=1 Tax=Myxocyprinus asiaticus TaxID=70543 RepID=UPI002223A3C4|nr:G-protein coupled receptor family C group 6 member A-like [Myxocyprinus asiaticus]